MIKEQIKKEFTYLSEEDVNSAYSEISRRLIKVNKVSNEIEAINFINNSLTLALNPEVRSTLPVCERSVYVFFQQLNYHYSPLKQTIHNARGVFHNSQYNAVTTLTN